MSTGIETQVERLTEEQEQYYIASAWQLMRRRFFRHKLALVGGVILIFLYLIAIFAGFVSPYDKIISRTDFGYMAPTRVRIFHEGRFSRPFVYGTTRERNPVTFLWSYSTETTVRYPIKFFVEGDPYKFVGIFDANVHLFGVDEPGMIYLFGADQLGRCTFSRVAYGARISLSIGLVGVALSFIIGSLLGGMSGFLGASVDMIMMRIVEFLESIPGLPLWMALAAAIPLEWPTVRKYFMITVILSFLGWTGLARTVRGKILQIREEDFVMAAKICGSSIYRIITRHMLPNFIGYLIVSLTLSIPGMILGETALSFIGIGLQAPVVSWGVALQQASNVRTIAIYWWLLIPSLFVVLTVLCFNAVGDGLRDAADPYK